MKLYTIATLLNKGSDACQWFIMPIGHSDGNLEKPIFPPVFDNINEAKKYASTLPDVESRAVVPLDFKNEQDYMTLSEAEFRLKSGF